MPAARAAGARVVIVNAEPTPFDGLADAVLRAPIGEVLPALCAAGGPAAVASSAVERGSPQP